MFLKYDLIGVTEAAISARRDHRTDEIQAADATWSVERVIGQHVDGKTVRMLEFRWNVTAFHCTAINVRRIGCVPFQNTVN